MSHSIVTGLKRWLLLHWMDWCMFYVCQPTVLNSIKAFLPMCMCVCMLLKKLTLTNMSILSYFTLWLYNELLKYKLNIPENSLNYWCSFISKLTDFCVTCNAIMYLLHNKLHRDDSINLLTDPTGSWKVHITLMSGLVKGGPGRV